ncbi:MAG: hypothetical protein M3Z25_23270 [Actinomycetota bacterium]|nr:hypothetical protein [Actinomycetota bacterium]
MERDHLYRLARPWPQSDRADAAAQQVRPGLRRLLDSTEVPSYIVGRNTDVLAWNPLAAALVTDFGALPPRQRNLARLVFLDEGMRSLYADWRDKASDVAAYLRLDAGRHPGDPRTAALIDEVTATSPELRQAWSEQSRKAPPPTQRFNCWRPGPKRVSDPIRPGRPRSRRTRGIRRTRARSDRTGSCRPR